MLALLSFVLPWAYCSKSCLCTARNVKLHSWAMLLSTGKNAPSGSARNPLLYVQLQTSMLSWARFFSISDHRCSYADRTLLYNGWSVQKSVSKSVQCAPLQS